MFKTILKISIPILLIGIILFIGYNTYQKTLNSTEDPITVIPTNASVIIKINDVRNLSRNLELTTLWEQLGYIEHIKFNNTQIKEISEFFTSNQEVFKSNTLFVSYHKVGANNSGTLFSTTFNRVTALNNETIIQLFGNGNSTSEYDNQEIFFLDKTGMYYSFLGDILFFSATKMLLTDAIRTSNKNTDNLYVNDGFSKAYNTLSSSADINLIFNGNNLIELTNTFTKNKNLTTDLSNWTATDIKLKDKVLLANGISSINSNITNYSDIFNGQKSSNIDIIEIIPENTTELLALSFSDAKDIFDGKNKILQNQNSFWSWDKNRKKIQDSCNVNYNELIGEIDEEAGKFNTSVQLITENTFTYFKAKESIRTTSLMQGMIQKSSEYNNHQINKLFDHYLTANLFGDLLKVNNPYFTVINDYFIFGNSPSALEYIIDNYSSNNTLSNSKTYNKFSSYISNDANFYYYINPGKTAETLQNSFLNSYAKQLAFNNDSIVKFTAFALQMSAKKSLLTCNICLFYDEDYKEDIKEEWYVALDTILVLNPQVVKNHFTKEEMVLTQDYNNKLFALNTSGETLWSIQVNGKILGEINYIDAFKNSKYQALFNTATHLYLVDRNGENVEGFPKELPSTTKLGHSLFDYSNNRNYRICIVGEDNIIYNLDKKGKKVKGWKYSKNTNRITQNPIHFTVNGKDFILNATKNTTSQLLARNGSARVTFKDAHEFANKLQINDKGELYAITTEGKLWLGNTNGNSQLIEISELDINSQILFHNNHVYISNNNKLLILDESYSQVNNITLDGAIISLKGFGDKLTISTENSLYLMEDGLILEGFPIDTDGYFNISDIDNNGKRNILNIKNGMLYNYELGTSPTNK